MSNSASVARRRWIVFEFLLMAALIADTVNIRNINWILGNILTAGVVSALGSAVRYTFQINTLLDANIGRYTLTACQVYFSIMTLRTSGRALMDTFYATYACIHSSEVVE